MMLICKFLSVVNSQTLTCENIILLSSLYLHSIHILIRTTDCIEKYCYGIHTYRFQLSFHEADHLENGRPDNQIAIIPLIIKSP